MVVRTPGHDEPVSQSTAGAAVDDSAESGPVEVDLRERDAQMRTWRDVEGLSVRQVSKFERRFSEDYVKRVAHVASIGSTVMSFGTSRSPTDWVRTGGSRLTGFGCSC